MDATLRSILEKVARHHAKWMDDYPAEREISSLGVPFTVGEYQCAVECLKSYNEQLCRANTDSGDMHVERVTDDLLRAALLAARLHEAATLHEEQAAERRER